MPKVDVELLKEACQALIDTIDATGGVRETPEGGYEPMADTEWYDLGDAYVKACEALGREPRVVPLEEGTP